MRWSAFTRRGVRISPNPKPFIVIRYGRGCRVQVNSEEVWFIEGDMSSRFKATWVQPRTLLEKLERAHEALEEQKYIVPMEILKEVSQFIRAKT